MAPDSVHLAKSDSVEKFPAGPMTGPSPGPTFEIAVADADGRIVASSNAAEIGELLSLPTLNEALAAPAPADLPLVARPLPAAAPA